MTSEPTLIDGADAVSRVVKSCPECAQRYSAESMFCPYDGTPLDGHIWVAPTDPSVDPLLGTLVDGRYRVERVLGEGGTGTVYEVTHTSLARLFAMKVLRADVARDPELANRFLQEAQATARLRHPHIVSITDFGNLPDSTPFFVMDKLVGPTLAEACRAEGKLPTGRAASIVLQVADAMAAAHEAGIVHRDLKPENLVLVQVAAGESTRDDVRVVDFGAAKLAGARRMTKTGIVFGTPHYMSPEQASGQPVDHRADIYALGVIMYEIFSGHLPFEADTLMGVLSKHLFIPPPRFDAASDPGAAHAGQLVALESVTLRALEKRPEARFQTMAELSAALKDAIDLESAAAMARATPSGPGVQDPVDGDDDAPGQGLSDLGADGRMQAVRWRRGAFVVAGVGVSLVLVVLTWLASRSSPDLQASEGAGSSVASATPPVARSVRLKSRPVSAEVWRDGVRLGTSPLDVPLDPGALPVRLTVRASGFDERTVVIDAASPALVDVPLASSFASASSEPPASPTSSVSPSPSASPPSPPKSRKAAPAARHRSASDGELVDPFSR